MLKELTAIDLFCGAGGLSEGFRQAGFRILAGNDLDEAAQATYESTHPEARFLAGAIENLSANDLLKASGLSKGELSCLIGGPPCQGFSVYNHQRGMHDKRSGLFKDYLRIVDGLQPRWVVLENVTGITSAGGGAAVAAIVQELERLGYHVDYRILKAENFGIPQERRRVIFLGNRDGKQIVWPAETHGAHKRPYVTVGDAIADLPPLLNGEVFSGKDITRPATSEYQTSLREGATSLLNHAAPRLAPVNLERMRFIPPGGSWRDIPVHLLPEGMKKARRCDHTKRYGRMTWDGLASTILTKCDLHWGAYIHPDQDRSISVREAARLQSFPDWFEFQGSRTEQYIQVGNAVPPLLGKCIASAIVHSSALEGAKQRSEERVAAQLSLAYA